MPSKQHLPALDGLRGIAILLVLWSHFPPGDAGGWAERLRIFVQPRYLGVDVFFVLSGFLITRILVVDCARGLPVGYFLVRRCLRIFPIYYLTLAVLAFVRPGPELPWCFAYLSNFYFLTDHAPGPLRHTWSLAVEEHFYLVWPWLVYGVASPRGRRWLVAAICAGALALAVALVVVARRQPWEPAVQDHFVRTWLHDATFFRVLSLVLGAGLALVEERVRALAHGVLASLVAAAASLALIGYGVFWRPPGWPILWWVGYALLSGAMLVGVLHLGAGRSLLGRALASAPLRFVGKISYGLYLYHAPIFFRLRLLEGTRTAEEGPAPMGDLVLGLALSFAVATASFYAVERPILRLQERFRARPAMARPSAHA